MESRELAKQVSALFVVLSSGGAFIMGLHAHTMWEVAYAKGAGEFCLDLLLANGITLVCMVQAWRWLGLPDELEKGK